MMTNTKENYRGYRTTKEQIDKLETFSAIAGISASEATRLGNDIISAFDAETWELLKGITDAQQFPIPVFIKHCVLKCVLEVDEQYKILGRVDSALNMLLAKELPAGTPIDFEAAYRPNLQKKYKAMAAEMADQQKVAETQIKEHKKFMSRKGGK
jgi:hypothetical protein